MPSKNKGIFYILLTAVISGFSIFINKYGVKFSNPYLFASLKNSIVALLLFSLILGTKDYKTLKKLQFKNWIKLIFIGLIGGSIPFLLFFKGLKLTSSAQASFIHKNMFLMVGFLAPIFLKEKLNKKYFIVALFLLLGNLLILGNIWQFHVNSGYLHVLGATILWAMEVVIAKKVLKNLPSNIVAWGRMFFGSLFLLGFLGITGQIGKIWEIGVLELRWIFITSLLLLAYVFCWYKGLKIVKASTASAILVLGSSVTTVLSLISKDMINASEIFGSILILFAVYILLNFKFISFKPKILNTKY